MFKDRWLKFVEYFFIASSVGGTIAAVTTKQIVWAATPLTLAIMMNAINRERFKKQLIEQTQESQNQTKILLTQQIEELKTGLTNFIQSNQSLPQNQDLLQQQLEELKTGLIHSFQLNNSLANRFSQLENLSFNPLLTSSIDELKNQLKQVNQILEHLNNTKAEKEAILEIESKTRQIQEFQQKIARILSDLDSNIPSSKDDEQISGFENKLVSFLKARKWQEANEETTWILIDLAGKQAHESLSEKDIKKLPSEKLNIIDGLWYKYSNGRFSWSIQKQIWENLGGRPKNFDTQLYEKWATKVGWRITNQWLHYSELNFTDESFIGHLPAIPPKWSSWGTYWCGRETISLFSQISNDRFHQNIENH